MSHFTVLVIGARTEEEVRKMLYPFRASTSAGKWDDFCIGGGWTGYFKLKKGAIGGTGPPDIFKEGYADMVEIGDIDWEGMRIDSERVGEEPSPITFAVIKNGQWHEQGWPSVINKGRIKVWEQEWFKLISDLPDDTPLALVDCHI